MAQAYNHMILPLASPRDRRTQVVWGARDFEHRFGRKPEGMWLPETAVDLATLEALAAEGIAFTILAPHQARRVRRIGGDDGRTCAIGRRSDDAVPRRAALGRVDRDLLLRRADLARGRVRAAARRPASASPSASRERSPRARTGRSSSTSRPTARPTATTTATATWRSPTRSTRSRAAGHATLTNYGEFLAKHPPTHEVEIAENTSWSCAHGVERWRSDCGCQTGAHPGWNQAWRAPLREALDALRDTVAPLWEAKAATLLADPWAARDEYDRRPARPRPRSRPPLPRGARPPAR